MAEQATFFAEHGEVSYGTKADAQHVCDTSASPIEGAAGAIAYALNRTPILERKLIDVASVLRSGDQAALNAMADEIEEMLCG